MTVLAFVPTWSVSGLPFGGAPPLMASMLVLIRMPIVSDEPPLLYVSRGILSPVVRGQVASTVRRLPGRSRLLRLRRFASTRRLSVRAGGTLGVSPLELADRST